MLQQREPVPVLRLCAAFSRHVQVLEAARERCARAWGPVALASAVFPFADTTYYEPTMGPGLLKQFWAFEPLADPGELAAWKRQSHGWEEDFKAVSEHTESRPLNLDPGYLTLAKLVLASTKDYAHRIYLRDGIYAEITLAWQKGGWVGHGWTFPDYRRPEYHAFFTQCRDYLHHRLRARHEC